MSESFTTGGVRITHGNVLDLYEGWDTPICIVSDGPYGIGGYPGDPRTYDALPEVYEPHVAAWSRKASPQTTLWFWGTELGWATVHPVLRSHGWIYRALNVWDKGMAHVAGNVNTKTIRTFPIVTEVCVQYVRASRVEVDGELLPGGAWLRAEWLRTGIPLTKANDACGVADAATRKWLTLDEALWYPPPPDRYALMVAYANEHGRPEGRPYFNRDIRTLRSKFVCEHGVTNVWPAPVPPRGHRMDNPHPNHKPLNLIRRILTASTEPGDMVWEPFGGSCPTAYLSKESDRRCEAAELNPVFYEAAVDRLNNQPWKLERMCAAAEALDDRA